MEDIQSTSSARSNNAGHIPAICFEIITVHPIHGEFYKGVLGDFILTIHGNTGFANASTLCASGNKRYSDWIKSVNNVEYIESLKNDATFKDKKVMYSLKEGPGYNSINGTYVCENILYQIAQWVSIEFRIKASYILSWFYKEQKRIEAIRLKLNSDFENALKCKNEELEHMKEQMKCKDEELEFKNVELKYMQETNAYLEKKKTNLEKTVNEMGKNYVQKLNDPLKRHVFGIVDKGIDDFFQVTTIRTQKRNYAKALKRKKERFPDAETIYYLKHHPNSISFFNRIKQEFPNVLTRYNDIHLPESYSIEEFIQDVDTEDQKPPRTRSESSLSENEYSYSSSD